MHDAARNEIDLSNQIGIVTGASGGLGSAISRALAARGMNVVLVARTTAPLENLARDTRRRWGRAQRLLRDAW